MSAPYDRWIDIERYTDALDVPIETAGKPENLVRATMAYRKMHEERLVSLGSRERNLRRLRERGLLSIKHEVKDKR